MTGVGSRGGNVRSVEEATQLQQTHKPTSSERAYEAICAALLKHGKYHRNLLPDLDLPPGDLNCIGSQVSVIKREGYMVKVGEERNRTAASNARWSPVYEITQLGRERLTDPGEQSPRVSAGAPSPKGSDGATNKPGEGSSCHGASQPSPETARSFEPLSLLPEPDPEAWAA
jgi:hypothetical protein